MTAKQKFKFRLLAGKHTDREGPPDKRGIPQLRVFRQGQVIETEKDLDALFNHQTIQKKKFEKVDDAIAASTPEYRISLSTPLTGVDAAQATLVRSQLEQPKPKPSQTTVSPTHGPAPNLPNQSTQPKSQVPDTLDSMSDKELDAFAASEEIDLSKARSKQDKIKAIRAAMG